MIAPMYVSGPLLQIKILFELRDVWSRVRLQHFKMQDRHNNSFTAAGLHGHSILQEEKLRKPHLFNITRQHVLNVQFFGG